MRRRVQILLGVLCCVVAIFTASRSTFAQSPGAQVPPPHLAYLEGVVQVVQDGSLERVDPPVLLLDGDIVRSSAGRAEIVFSDGSVLHLADHSELEVLAGDRFRLSSGRALVRTTHTAQLPLVFDTPGGVVQLQPEGEYLIDADGERLDLAIVRGRAMVVDDTTWTLRGGQRLLLATGGRPLIQSFNTARLDNFTRWAHERSNSYARSVSAGRLPEQLRPYSGVLEQHGRWDYLEPHGYVWYPSVSVGWRPYYDGSWTFTKFGWTWRGHERWAWPTHHYGRWGYNGNFWYWVPATTWGPAWVAWGVGAGYVSWSPLGWDGRPSFYSYDRYYDHPAYAPRYGSSFGWTVLPRQHFAPKRPVRTHAVDPGRLDGATRTALFSGPAIRTNNDIAVPASRAGRGGTRNPSDPRDRDPRTIDARDPAASGTEAPTSEPTSGRTVALPRRTVALPGNAVTLPSTAVTGTSAPDARGRSRRAADDPAYTPPSTWSGVAGAASTPDAAFPRDRRPRGDLYTIPAVPADGSPSARPRSAPPPDSYAGPETSRPTGTSAVPRGSAPDSRGRDEQPRSYAPPPQASPSGGTRSPRTGGDGGARGGGRAPSAAPPAREGSDSPRAGSSAQRSGEQSSHTQGGARRRPSSQQ